MYTPSWNISISHLVIILVEVHVNESSLSSHDIRYNYSDLLVSIYTCVSGVEAIRKAVNQVLIIRRAWFCCQTVRTAVELATVHATIVRDDVEA